MTPTPPLTPPSLPLPSPLTLPWCVLCSVAIISPYLFILGIYRYHFVARKSSPKLRKPNDAPLASHVNDWQTALFRPEGISGVVGYMILGLTLSLTLPQYFEWVVPKSIQTLDFSVNPLILLLYFLVFDSTMWCIHFLQHRWRWLYYNTHSTHHTIKSPTMVVALTGYLPDTCLLILVPLHFTISIVPYGNFFTIFLFSVMSLFHLHCIHSDFQHSWDPLFRSVGIVNSWDHHVHHLRPRKNLAHFFVILDKVMGTYEDPLNFPNILSSK